MLLDAPGGFGDSWRLLGWLEAGWREVGAGWGHAGGRLEAGWRQPGGRLEAGWRQAGGRLEEVLNLGDCVDGMHHRFCAPELGEQVQGAKVTVPSAHTTSDKYQY